MIEIVFHGTGGQGVVIAAKLLADAAAKSGYRSQSFAAYGGERRGGRVESYLRVSESGMTIHSKIYEPDYVVVMNENLANDPAIAAGLKQGGTVLINSARPPSSFTAIDRVKVRTIDANMIAEENGVVLASGLPVVNTTIAGAVAAFVPLIGIDELGEAIRESGIPSPEKNIKAALNAYRRFASPAGDMAAAAKVSAPSKIAVERFPAYRNGIPPCEANCPAGEPVEQTVSLVQQGRFTEALANIKNENPFPGICGRICFHPCETHCNRNEYDQSIATQALERAAFDHADAADAAVPAVREKTGKKVAIIGSGPAGMSCACFLRRLGHDVTVFEALPHVGGIPRAGIPDYRLPKGIVDREMEEVIRNGVTVHTNTRVGKDVIFSKIIEDYDAVFVAVGLQQSMRLGIPGEDSRRVILGLDFLKNVASGKKTAVGRKVTVIGGGNVAIDAARTAKRLGAKVQIVCLESREMMPAYAAEIEEAEKEGIEISCQVMPLSIDTTGKRHAGLECIRVDGGKRDDRGWIAWPQKIEGTDFLLTADKIIVAIGSRLHAPFLEGKVEMQGSVIKVDGLGRTSLRAVFAGGDATLARGSVVEAIGSGKRAALGIDLYLRGGNEAKILKGIRIGQNGAVSMEKYLTRQYEPADDRMIGFNEINTAYFEKRPRAAAPRLDEKGRTIDFSEVNLGLSRQDAAAEAERCFHCGRCNLCENCFIFCPDRAISFDDKTTSFTVDRTLCKVCGICINECPRSAISWEDKA